MIHMRLVRRKNFQLHKTPRKDHCSIPTLQKDSVKYDENQAKQIFWTSTFPLFLQKMIIFNHFQTWDPALIQKCLTLRLIVKVLLIYLMNWILQNPMDLMMY